jgi:uncharacterized protein YjbI with pentapeptide repeats
VETGLWIALGAVLLVFAVCLALAWLQAGRGTEASRARSQLLGGVASALLAAGLVALSLVLLMPRTDEEALEEAFWRANVAVTHDLTGFDPHGHSLSDLSFANKILVGANFSGMSLEAMTFDYANLNGADLERTNLVDASLTGADLSTASLAGADLRRAFLEGTRFDQAAVEGVRSLEGAVATPATCWPAGFLDLTVAQGLEPGEWEDAQGNVEQGVGHESPCPAKYRTP